VETRLQKHEKDLQRNKEKELEPTTTLYIAMTAEVKNTCTTLA